jgi:hypothetical protein
VRPYPHCAERDYNQSRCLFHHESPPPLRFYGIDLALKIASHT